MAGFIFLTIVLLFGHGVLAVPLNNSTDSAPPEDVSFHDIFALIPKENITRIAADHLKTDAGFKAAVKYLQSKEWINLVDIIGEKPEWIALKSYLKGLGFDIEVAISCMKSFIESLNVTIDDVTAKKNLTSFIIDVEQTIPYTRVMAVFHDKILNNKHFQEVFDKLSNEESRKILENALSLKEVNDAIRQLKEMGLDLTNLFTLIFTFLGWGDFKLAE